MNSKNVPIIVSLGGSIINPSVSTTNTIDIHFIKDFKATIIKLINNSLRFIIVVGGGNTARLYQQSFCSIKEANKEHMPDNTAADRIGIAATQLNAQFIQEIFADYTEDFIVKNPSVDNIPFNKPLLIASGWKPGFSTDYIAVILAKKYNIHKIINLSNIEKIYTADPKKHTNATALDEISWENLIKMIGTQWTPGLHVPFDPIAAKLAKTLNLEVICANGKNIRNFYNIIKNTVFIGTKIYNH